MRLLKLKKVGWVKVMEWFKCFQTMSNSTTFNLIWKNIDIWNILKSIGYLDKQVRTSLSFWLRLKFVIWQFSVFVFYNLFCRAFTVFCYALVCLWVIDSFSFFIFTICLLLGVDVLNLVMLPSIILNSWKSWIL